MVNPPASRSTFASCTGGRTFSGSVTSAWSGCEAQPTTSADASTIGRMRRISGCVVMFHLRVVPGGRCRGRLLGRPSRSRGGRQGRSVHITVDRAEEADAHFRFRVTSRHHDREPAETLLDPRAENTFAQQFKVLVGGV